MDEVPARSADPDRCGIVIAGVGGQGAAVAGNLLALAAVRSGWHATSLETRGMAQRGGSVTTHTTLSRMLAMFPPRLEADAVDVVLGLEPIEALRAARTFPGTRVLLVGAPILPTGRSYPPTAEVHRNLERVASDLVVAMPPGGVRSNVFGVGAVTELLGYEGLAKELSCVADELLVTDGPVHLTAGLMAIRQMGFSARWRLPGSRS